MLYPDSPADRCRFRPVQGICDTVRRIPSGRFCRRMPLSAGSGTGPLPAKHAAGRDPVKTAGHVPVLRRCLFRRPLSVCPVRLPCSGMPETGQVCGPRRLNFPGTCVYFPYAFLTFEQNRFTASTFSVSIRLRSLNFMNVPVRSLSALSVRFRAG